MFIKNEREVIVGCIVEDDGIKVPVECRYCAINERCYHKWKTEEQIKEEKEFLAKYQG